MNPEYHEKVSQAFLEQTGRGFMLSPRDQELVSRWEKAGIPSDVVIEGINAAFETPPSRRVHSINFVSSSVERAAKVWRTRRAGSGDESIDHDAEWDRALSALIVQLTEAKSTQIDSPLVSVIDAGITGIKTIRSAWRLTPHYSVQTELERLESEIYDASLAALPPLERLELERAVEVAMTSEVCDTPAVYATTKRAFTRRRLRRLIGLPTFELDPTGGW